MDNAGIGSSRALSFLALAFGTLVGCSAASTDEGSSTAESDALSRAHCGCPKGTADAGVARAGAEPTDEPTDKTEQTDEYSIDRDADEGVKRMCGAWTRARCGDGGATHAPDGGATRDAGAARDAGQAADAATPATDAGSRPATPPTCTSFTYSAWGACAASSTQTRTEVSASPAGCAGGSPVLGQACTPAIDGAALYAQTCATCHGNGKKGSSVSAIKAAIASNRGGMGSLNLSDAQITAISAAP